MSESYLKAYSLGLPEALAIVGLMLVSAVALWLIRNALTPFNDHQKLREGTTALAIERGSYQLAQVIAMAYAIGGFDPDYPTASLVLIALKDVFILVVLVLFGYIVDWATLPKIKNDELLLQNNYALAVAMAGTYLGIGFVLGGATVGTATTLAQSALATIVFATMGLGVVIGAFWLHVVLSRKAYNLHQELRQGNINVAIDAGSLVLAVSLLVSIGVAGDMTSWWDAMKAFGATLVFALGLLFVFQWLVNRLATKGAGSTATQQSGNTALVTMVAAGRLGLALGLWAVVGNVL